MIIYRALALSIALLPTAITVPLVPSYFEPELITRREMTSRKVQRELGGCLSNTTTIFGPEDVRFDNTTRRWGTFAVPTIQVVVQPGTEWDVSKIVKYCNKQGIDYLVYTGGHGTPKSLATFNGVLITMAKLRDITIDPDGQSAWVQGGVHGGELTRAIWDKGHVATTGACDCVGVAGAGLGGGHGRLEGLYGLISDNMVQFNAVLADGTRARVNATSYNDLYWALRGAGHNFAIITSMQMKIYSREILTWHYKSYIWRGEQLDNVFTAINDLHGNGTTPVNMAFNVGNFLYMAAISEMEPVISWQFAFRGSEEDAAPFLEAFDAIDAVSSASGNVPYPDLAHAQSVGDQDEACTSVADRIISTAGLQVYNLTAEHQIWDSFTRKLAEKPELGRLAFIIHEGYSTKAVAEQPSDSSAYPFRADHLLTQFQGNLEPDSGLEGQMVEWSREVQDLWNAGQPERLPNAYVNYASGFESVANWYGHEEWRLQRLRRLKSKYDPHNRFRFYNPIM